MRGEAFGVKKVQWSSVGLLELEGWSEPFDSSGVAGVTDSVERSGQGSIHTKPEVVGGGLHPDQTTVAGEAIKHRLEVLLELKLALFALPLVEELNSSVGYEKSSLFVLNERHNLGVEVRPGFLHLQGAIFPEPHGFHRNESQTNAMNGGF